VQALVDRGRNFATRISAFLATGVELRDAITIFGSDPGHHFLGKIFLERLLLDEIDRRLVRSQARVTLFNIDHPVVFHAEFGDQDRQSQSLKDKRRQNDAEGEKQNVAAAGKWLPVSQDNGEGKGRGQRDHAAHPGPGNKNAMLPGWNWIARPQFRAQPARQISGRKDPGNPHQHDRGADEKTIGR
jgi:hypothetical protein